MIVIYHANCADGFTAAFIMWTKYPDAEFIPIQYGDNPPDVTDKNVFIVDFSFPRKILNIMKQKAKSLVVLDHHKTAKAELTDLDYCIFDMQKSGARLTWEYLFSGTSIPSLIAYVEDRDLWKWELPKSKEISAYLATLPKKFDVWNSLSERLERGEISSVVELGEVALRVVDQYVETQVSRARLISMDGYTIPCINTTFAISELVGKLAESELFAAGWFQRDDGRFVYSLRSRGDSEIDVSEIARKYGGGGHPRAAGFTSDRLIHSEAFDG